MKNTVSITSEELLSLAYAQNPKLPKAGEVIWNYGHPFVVTEPMVSPVINPEQLCHSHQFTYVGVCTEHEANDSIRHTGYNGGRYGFGVNVTSSKPA